MHVRSGVAGQTPSPATAIFRSRRHIGRREHAIFTVPTFSMVDDVQNRIRRMFDDAFDLEPITQPIGLMPPTEILETKEELILTAELPGLSKKDVDIAVDNGVLTIKGEKIEERKEVEEEKKYLMWERTYGAFSRSFTLPHTVDTAKINAEFVNGVLRVHLPKTLEAKTKGRKIEVIEK
jgi:HSP20 family protein